MQGMKNTNPTLLSRPSGKRLTAQAAADYLGVTTDWLARRRMRGDGPKFLRLGGRLVRYDVRELDRYLEASTRKSTAQRGE